MKTLILSLLITTTVFAQKEGQSFCDGDTSEDYFTLQIAPKYAVWYDTSYIETVSGEKEINSKKYKIYTQLWKSGSKDTLYMREEGNSVYQYNEVLKKDILRYDSTMPEGKSWKGKDVTYTILSKNKELTTPVCKYKNLLELKAEYPTVTYNFYYLKGFGYIGATKDGRLISFVMPKMP